MTREVGLPGRQSPHEIVPCDSPAGGDLSKCLVGKVPLSPQKTPGLMDGLLEREILQTLEWILGDKAVDGAFGRQDPARVRHMRPEALLLLSGRPLPALHRTEKVKPP
jgi:hypothetical protein